MVSVSYYIIFDTYFHRLFIENVTLTGTWIGVTDSPLGSTNPLQWTEKSLKLTVGNGSLAIPELFVGTRKIMDKAVKLVNSRADLLRKELIPQINQPLSHYILDVLTKIHNKIPNDILYPTTSKIINKITSVVKPLEIL